jgi:glycerol-3-phosphate dehydrogenase
MARPEAVRRAGRRRGWRPPLPQPRRDAGRLPTAQPEGLKGGVEYWDGQFDDARLALALARTAAAQGALVVNYCAVTGLLHEGGKVVGVRCEDREGGAANSRCGPAA